MTFIVRQVYIPPAMHLSDYMQANALSDDAVAIAIGKSRASVSRYRRKVERPASDTMQAIYDFSQGMVTPNDWFELAIPMIENAAVPATEAAE